MPTPYDLPTRTRLQQLAGALWTERSSFDQHWRELGEYLMPRRTRFWAGDRNRGDKRNQKILHARGLLAARTLASGLHAGLTSPARPWFTLSTPDPDLNRRPAVKAWLHDVTQHMLAIFQESNLYNSLPMVYGDMGLFGTAAMAILDDGKDLFRSYTFPIGSYALGIDARGVATTFYREYATTVRQIVEDFGGPNGTRMPKLGGPIDWSTISPTVKDLWNKGEYETAVEVCWIVLPNPQSNPNRLESKYKRWASYHYDKFTQAPGAMPFLRESGFDTFPVLCPRWEVTSHEDTYGTNCPGMTALADVKQLQTQQRSKGRAIDKMIDPAVVGSSQLRTQVVSLLPHGITYEDVTHAQLGLRPVYQIDFNIAPLTADMQEIQQIINECFYVDLFRHLLDDQRNQRATAREVDATRDEIVLNLGPVLEGTNDELLDPLVDRTYHLMDLAGLLPDPPEELGGVRLTVEYKSLLAQAQKLVGVVAQDRFLNSVAALAQTYPDAADSVDERAVIEEYADMLGVVPRILRTKEAAQALGDARRQAQAQAQQADNLQKMAAAGKSASQSSLTNDGALAALNAAAGASAQRPTDATVTP